MSEPSSSIDTGMALGYSRRADRHHDVSRWQLVDDAIHLTVAACGVLRRNGLLSQSELQRAVLVIADRSSRNFIPADAEAIQESDRHPKTFRPYGTPRPSVVRGILSRKGSRSAPSHALPTATGSPAEFKAFPRRACVRRLEPARAGLRHRVPEDAAGPSAWNSIADCRRARPPEAVAAAFR